MLYAGDEMKYVIYNKETTVLFKSHIERYASESAAKAALTRHSKKFPKFNRDDYAIANAADFFNNIEKTVVRKNLMSGVEFTERVNTPYYCSPSSESYWSM